MKIQHTAIVGMGALGLLYGQHIQQAAGPGSVWIAPSPPERLGFDKIIIFPFSEKCKEKAGVLSQFCALRKKGPRRLAGPTL